MTGTYLAQAGEFVSLAHELNATETRLDNAACKVFASFFLSGYVNEAAKEIREALSNEFGGKTDIRYKRANQRITQATKALSYFGEAEIPEYETSLPDLWIHEDFTISLRKAYNVSRTKRQVEEVSEGEKLYKTMLKLSPATVREAVTRYENTIKEVNALMSEKLTALVS